MPALIIRLPADRDFCGTIQAIADDGALLAGPFRIAGRADAAAAARAGNPARSPLFLYGDTPCGRYKSRYLLPTGAATNFDAAIYGPHGVLVLTGSGGDAALAEANGRFHILLHGGGLGAGGRLCATNGALRMDDDKLKILLGLFAVHAGMECWCVEDRALPCTEAVCNGSGFDEGDPPDVSLAGRREMHPSRRAVLSGAAAIGAVSAMPVLLPGIFIAAETALPARAFAAYDDGEAPQPDSGNKAY